MQIEIVKRKTKSFRLSIDKDGAIKVSVPLFATKKQVEAFVSANQEWISLTLEKVLDKKKERERRLAERFGQTLYLGVWHEVKFDSNVKCLSIANNIIICKDEKALKMWLKKEALRIFTPKCLEIASFYGVEISKISVRFAKSRWGSCSLSGAISLNINLIKAPRSVIEYVIIHEVAHRVAHNHSKTFWNEVKKLCPEYRISEKWLKDNGFFLV